MSRTGVLGANEKLAPPIRCGYSGAIELLQLSPDAKSLFAAVKSGDGHDLVAWDIPSKSKTVLWRASPPHAPFSRRREEACLVASV